MLKQILLDLVKSHPEIVAAAVVKFLRAEADKIEKDPTIVSAWVEQIVSNL